jgi:TetR/AcrR family transcriptional regulator, transcriptional repressor for nem operon
MRQTEQRLMDRAEARISEAGYRGFSFRELAAEVGIKSASVHHYFPTKARMAAAVARRYGERFFELVASGHNGGNDDVIASYRSVFRGAIEQDGRMCLNGMLGAEAGGLPSEVVDEIRVFFQRCVDDLSSRLSGPDAVARAFQIMATLEGGLILARAFGDVAAFDRATASLSLATLQAAS